MPNTNKNKATKKPAAKVVAKPEKAKAVAKDAAKKAPVVVEKAEKKLTKAEKATAKLHAKIAAKEARIAEKKKAREAAEAAPCLLYTSPSPRDRTRSRMPSSA